MSDFVIFQLKLFVDGLKDGVVFTTAIVAFVADLVFRRRGKQRYFYKVLKLSQHFDEWLNLHGVVEGFNSKGLSRLHVSPKRLRELIMDEEDLPVEVGSLATIEAELVRADYGTTGIEIMVFLDEDEPMPDFTKGVTLTVRPDDE